MSSNPSIDNCVLGDVLSSVESALDSLNAIRRADHFLKTEDRYSFTNDADAVETEKAREELVNAIQLLQSLGD
jgi:hypothetical protein